jgi:hypothetical protein
MHWDIVEVRPEPGYCLFLRFKDVLSARVRLRSEEFTGVLEPLRDASSSAAHPSIPALSHGQATWI